MTLTKYKQKLVRKVSEFPVTSYPAPSAELLKVNRCERDRYSNSASNFPCKLMAVWLNEYKFATFEKEREN